MRTASNKDQRRILAKACEAGWRVKDTNKGWLVLSPDGQFSVAMHTTSSDHKALKNIKSDFKKAGLELDE